jgi:hypothetical protein
MKWLGCLILIVLAALSGCTGSARFDPSVWRRNGKITDQSNPRARMVADLMQHHLRTGLPRDSVLFLLGPPYREGIERRLPKGVKLPDSLSVTSLGIPNSNAQADSLKAKMDAQVKGINAFYRQHAQPDTLMRYPIGWSTIDPNFLIIRLTDKGRVAECWVEQG